MKQVLALDLNADKAAVALHIDRWYHGQIQHRMLLAPLYAVKVAMAHAALERIARGGIVLLSEHPPALVREATERGDSVEVLSRAIFARAREREAEVLELDAQRRQAKRELAAATTGQRVAAVLARFT